MENKNTIIKEVFVKGTTEPNAKTDELAKKMVRTDLAEAIADLIPVDTHGVAYTNEQIYGTVYRATVCCIENKDGILEFSSRNDKPSFREVKKIEVIGTPSFEERLKDAIYKAVMAKLGSEDMRELHNYEYVYECGDPKYAETREQYDECVADLMAEATRHVMEAFRAAGCL